MGKHLYTSIYALCTAAYNATRHSSIFKHHSSPGWLSIRPSWHDISSASFDIASTLSAPVWPWIGYPITNPTVGVIFHYSPTSYCVGMSVEDIETQTCHYLFHTKKMNYQSFLLMLPNFLAVKCPSCSPRFQFNTGNNLEVHLYNLSECNHCFNSHIHHGFGQL